MLLYIALLQSAGQLSSKALRGTESCYKQFSYLRFYGASLLHYLWDS